MGGSGVAPSGGPDDPARPRAGRAGIVTVGHGTTSAEALCALLHGAGVTHLVDVRSYPASRRHPHFAREAMAAWLADDGLAYSWEPRLGGRRRPRPGSRHLALTNPAFQAYADHMESAEFGAGLADVLARSDREAVAVLCAESLWWRCHRRLLADALALLGGADVRHLLHDGRLEAHRPTDCVRLEVRNAGVPDARGAGSGERHLVYDVGVTGRLVP